MKSVKGWRRLGWCGGSGWGECNGYIVGDLGGGEGSSMGRGCGVP